MRQVGDRQETTMGVYVWDGQRDQFHPYSDADGKPLAFRYWRSKPGVFRHGDHYIRTQPPDRNGMVPVKGRQTFRGSPPAESFRCVLDTPAGGLWHPDRLAEYDEINEGELPDAIRREFAPWGPSVFPGTSNPHKVTK